MSVPIEMQKQSLALRGWIHVLKEEPSDFSFHVRAVGADVISDLADMCVGWELNADGVVRGKHFSSQFRDPTLVCPSIELLCVMVEDGLSWSFANVWIHWLICHQIFMESMVTDMC